MFRFFYVWFVWKASLESEAGLEIIHHNIKYNCIYYFFYLCIILYHYIILYHCLYNNYILLFVRLALHKKIILNY